MVWLGLGERERAMRPNSWPFGALARRVLGSGSVEKKTRHLGLLAAAAIVAAGVTSAACSSSSSLFEGPQNETGGGPSGGPSANSPDGGATSPPPVGRGDQPSNGVMLVHAADFPPMRLCFAGRPDAQPIPNATTMPDANIVGLDIGTGIRLAPIQNDKPLGAVYVIEVDPNRIRNGFDENATCGQLICAPGSGPQCLTAGRDYATAGTIADATLGVSRLTVLAVKGCGNGFQIDQLGVPQGECGAGYDVLQGNVTVTRIESLDLQQRAPGSLPVQLVNLSNRLAPGPLGDVRVRYGQLAGDAGDAGDAGAGALDVVASKPEVDVPQPSRNLALSSDESVYGTHGFVIDRSTGSGNAFEVRASLADVQEDSAPLSLPSDYYASASKYALLLLGDPRAQQPTDPRRVHLIAVPMTDPADVTGPDAGATTSDDGGTGDKR